MSVNRFLSYGFSGEVDMTSVDFKIHDSFRCQDVLEIGAEKYRYFSLHKAEGNGLEGISRLPWSLKVLIENLLRHEDGKTVTVGDIRAVAGRLADREIAFHPTRVLMQDFSGLPAIVDLAAMRDAAATLGADPARINPVIPVDMVVDHSLTVDFSGSAEAFERNAELEHQRNRERYAFLRWGAQAFRNFRTAPPGSGICHQVNLEHLAQTVWTSAREGDDASNELLAYPDTVVGADSHTTMVNGLSALGWGVGGIEAEAAMLGQPISMLVPEVVGMELTGALRDGATATDLALTVTERLRGKGVVGKFVEFFGSGLDRLGVEDRATLANMAPEYGATCGFFPIDDHTLAYLRLTGRSAGRIALVEAYARAQGLWRDRDAPAPLYASVETLDLSSVERSVSGPRRPQERTPLAEAPASLVGSLAQSRPADGGRKVPAAASAGQRGAEFGADALADGHVVIAAITSCTNTSHPGLLVAAGLLARKARRLGLQVKPWVKTSLAPGSRAVTAYLEKAGLQEDLDALGFNLVGYGCATCIGNSGPLPEPITSAICDNDLVVAAVLSGNRNFEGRINPHVRANYLASPPLVVAYALAGSLKVDLTREPLGEGRDGVPVHLDDIWPSAAEISGVLQSVMEPELFQIRYASLFDGDPRWTAIGEAKSSLFYPWSETSTYIRRPPFFDGMTREPEPVKDIRSARILGLFLDSITTDHISPAGYFDDSSPAGQYLASLGVEPADFNSYGARRGNHEVLVRGVFAHGRIRNQMAPGTQGAVTAHHPSGELAPIFDVAEQYRADGAPLVVFAGKDYGAGSSRDWAAKGPKLLGVRAVIAQSFERIHRSNLIGMGIVPLAFKSGRSWQDLGLDGSETVTIAGLDRLSPGQDCVMRIDHADGACADVTVSCCIYTSNELAYYRNGGIMPYMLRKLALGE
jgi:aconitate hydratase